MPQSAYLNLRKSRAKPMPKSDIRVRDTFQRARARKKKEAKDEDRRESIRMINMLVKRLPF